MRFSFLATIFIFITSGILVYASGSSTYEQCRSQSDIDPEAQRFLQQNRSQPFIRPLTQRHPSPETMNDYLHQFDTEHFIDKAPYRTQNAYWEYIDLSGDGVDDLVIRGRWFADASYVKILIWSSFRYCDPFTSVSSGGNGGGVTTSLEDWTNDGVPEIIRTAWIPNSTASWFTSRWSTYMISCVGGFCRSILSVPEHTINVTYDNGEYSIRRTYLDRDTVDETPILRFRSEGFTVHPFNSTLPPLVIEPVMNRIYQWNGTLFELMEEREVVPAFSLGSMQILSATNSLGEIATVTLPTATPSGGWTNCTISIQEEQVGFCVGRPEFVRITWQDVTNDGIEELLVWDVTSNGKGLTCFHQTLTIYQAIKGGYTRLPAISGCVMGSDLHGVRIEDLDGDGQVEIIAARDLLTSSRLESETTFPFPVRLWENVYLFDGTSFVHPKPVPLD